MQSQLRDPTGGNTLKTLVVGGFGAGIAWWISAPVFILIGPALAVSVAGLWSVRTAIHPVLRDLCFLVLGVAVGAGFDADAVGVMLRWPLAFAVMLLVIVATLLVCRGLLVRLYGFDRRAAILAAAPGHLSFVVAAATAMQADVARISIAQSVRLLALTLLIPFVAFGFGIDVSGIILPVGQTMTLFHVSALLVLGLALGLLFTRLSLPAPLLLGAMCVSALGHLSSLTPGYVPDWLLMPAYLVLGALIGTRFCGVDLSMLRRGFLVGMLITFVAVLFSALGAVPMAWALGMPPLHVLVAFAPGGLETMIAMGVILGAVPGFVAACHIARLLMLTVLLPVFLAGSAEAAPQQDQQRPQR
ncbi:MAG: AbrB family transcriptional regulator [Pseudomonadota bacterium]